jgi:hypothetical protein
MTQMSDFAAYMADFPPDHPFFRGLKRLEHAAPRAPKPRRHPEALSVIEAVETDNPPCETAKPTTVEESIRQAFLRKIERRCGSAG